MHAYHARGSLVTPQQQQKHHYRLGIDIGSTTIKCALIDEQNTLISSSYTRHNAQTAQALKTQLIALTDVIENTAPLTVGFSGSAALGLATTLNLPFVQEVYATKCAVEHYLPNTDAVIELGGEDAKVLFLSNGLEVRMNGTCAGGTGAFIDQMASLLNVEIAQLDALAKKADKTYPIASRCGVFAKSDIQPLLNQGARREDLAKSIFHAVANQTIAGLAQGRLFKGSVVYLGGPLTFLPGLRKAFNEALSIEGTCPPHSLLYVALGTALALDEAAPSLSLARLLDEVSALKPVHDYATLSPLFENQAAYEAFTARHNSVTVPTVHDSSYKGNAYLGVDAGSTTLKIVVIDEDERLLFTRYASNGGNPLPLVKGFLEEFYREYPQAHVVASAATGYGEAIIKEAFRLDFGIVETVAHFLAARSFEPNVDFIIDIGGQDIKCFKIVDGAIDDLFLNEACSSGCGSFLQSFAQVLGYDLPTFTQKGLFAHNPVDLGSRCTVFMNSGVKQAQKDGAGIDDIAAGLAVSVVKNALYKVIRTSNAAELGKRIVVQGGTFLNDAVLKAFEDEIGHPVVRPAISGLMGAFGAALYARNAIGAQDTTTLDQQELATFSHAVRSVTCRLCTNHCSLTINTFQDGRKFVAGNRCERPLSTHNKQTEKHDLYRYKQECIEKYRKQGRDSDDRRGTIGMPLALNIYEMLPFWTAFFTQLGFKLIVTPPASHESAIKGQHTIPSDTVCYPAKLVHGQIEHLLDQDLTAIFYPCFTYNFDEKRGTNHFNCPVVAYYPEVIEANVDALKDSVYLAPFLGIHRRRDFARKITEVLQSIAPDIILPEVIKATKAAFIEQNRYRATVREEGQRIVHAARDARMPIVVLAGRPYHVDQEVNHGINDLITRQGAAVITEDAVCDLVHPFKVNVLNQWTYHARLYEAARYVGTQSDMNLVQLVSFGCGVDAITTDEVRSILRATHKIYTQIKIDEITNLGAITIRIRSLFAATTEAGV